MSKEKEILYHYCSTDTFKSIIEGKTIRLSSLDQSNDMQEGKILQNIFDKKLMEHLYFDREYFDSIEQTKWMLKDIQDLWTGFGFCLSTQPDLLSQWRGYADNAKGFAIGFEKEKLKKLIQNSNAGPNFQQGVPDLHEIKYINSDVAIDSAEEIMDLYLKLVKSGFEDEQYKVLQDKLAQSSRHRYYYKNSGFQEECEWRIIASVQGEHFSELDFISTQGGLKPYLTIPFLHKEDVIEEIIIGPKQSTPMSVISGFLKKHSLSHVELNKSKISFI